MKPEEYGTIVSTQPILNYIRYIVSSGSRVYKIDAYSNINEVTILGASDLKWTDTVVSGECFKREIHKIKSTIYFMDGEVILRKQVLPAKPFRKAATDKKVISHFVTMDIETVKLDGKMVPYTICGTNGTQNISSFATVGLPALSSSSSQKELFNLFMKQLLNLMALLKQGPAKSKRMIVYAHNLS